MSAEQLPDSRPSIGPPAYAPPQRPMVESVNGIAYLRPEVAAPAAPPISGEPTQTVGGIVYLNPHQINAALPPIKAPLPGAPTLTKKELSALFGRLSGTYLGASLGVMVLVIIAAIAASDTNEGGRMPPMLVWPACLALCGGLIWAAYGRITRLRTEINTSNTVTEDGRLTLASAMRPAAFGGLRLQEALPPSGPLGSR